MGAIFADGVVVDGIMAACAAALYAVPSRRSSAKLLIATAPIFLSMVFLLRMGLFYQAAIDTAPHFAATPPAPLLNSFANGECFAQRRLPTRAELLGGSGVRHEEIESVESAAHDQEFGCDSGMNEPARILHVFFDEQVDRTDTDPGRR